jgi:predicted MFS family arabinose efflux permease
MSSSGTQQTDPLISEFEENPTAEAAAIAEDTEASRRGGLASTFRSLRHRNYRLYFFGQMISLVGTWMQTTVVLWLAFKLTNQPKWPPLVSAAAILPTFLFGAWGGSLADRLPKRSLIFATQVLFTSMAFLLAALVWFGAVTAWQLLVITAMTGLVTAVDLPARLAFVLDMVAREDLMNAVALNSLLFNVARACGPAIGGIVLGGGGAALSTMVKWFAAVEPETDVFLRDWGGAFLCFFLNGVSYLAVLWALWQMSVSGSPGRSRGDHPRPSLVGGFRYLAGHRELAYLTLLGGLAGFCGWPFQALLPAVASKTLGGAAREYSWMLTATGVGALLAAWAVATFGSIERKQRLIAGGAAIVTIALIGLSQSTNILMAVATCAAIGFGLILVLSTAQSVVQLSAGEHNRGQIMGVWAMVLCGAVPLGNFLTAPLADLWGAPAVLLLLGCLAGAGALLLLALFRPWQIGD